MRITLAALAWAIAILGVALGASSELIGDSAASTLLIVLPILAANSLCLLGRSNCRAACGARA